MSGVSQTMRILNAQYKWLTLNVLTGFAVGTQSNETTTVAIQALRAAQPLALRSLFSSHGSMEPSQIMPGVFKYVISLDEPTAFVALVPELLRSGLSFIPEEMDVPKVHMSWPDMAQDSMPESSALAMKKQIRLPDNGADLSVLVTIKSLDGKDSASYKVVYKQKYLPPAQLLSVNGKDSTGRIVVSDPAMIDEDTHTVKLFVNPNATSVELSLKCNSKSSLKVNGKYASSGIPIRINRELFHHNQIVEVRLRIDAYISLM